MSKYLFKTGCPACGDREIILWCHNPKKCGGNRYIDKDLYLHCNKCNEKTFLFDATFDCGKHDFRKPEFLHFFKALALLEHTSDIPYDILREMLNKAMHYRHY